MKNIQIHIVLFIRLTYSSAIHVRCFVVCTYSTFAKFPLHTGVRVIDNSREVHTRMFVAIIKRSAMNHFIVINKHFRRRRHNIHSRHSCFRHSLSRKHAVHSCNKRYIIFVIQLIQRIIRQLYTCVCIFIAKTGERLRTSREVSTYIYHFRAIMQTHTCNATLLDNHIRIVGIQMFRCRSGIYVLTIVGHF